MNRSSYSESDDELQKKTEFETLQVASGSLCFGYLPIGQCHRILLDGFLMADHMREHPVHPSASSLPQWSCPHFLARESRTGFWLHFAALFGHFPNFSLFWYTQQLARLGHGADKKGSQIVNISLVYPDAGDALQWSGDSPRCRCAATGELRLSEMSHSSGHRPAGALLYLCRLFLPSVLSTS